MHFPTLRTLAALAAVTMATGCSIMHPIADDYDQYLDKNQVANQFQPVKTADRYFLPAATQSHHYEFRAATVGYAHVWVVDFGKMLDATMRSQDVVKALGKLDKAASQTEASGNTLVFDLQKYTFEDHGAHIELSISVKNSAGDVFKKSYRADGKTQGGKMFWAGPFGMKNAVQQSTKLALDQVIVSFIADMKAAQMASAAK